MRPVDRQLHLRPSFDHFFNASVQAARAQFLTSVPSGDDREAKRIWLLSAYGFSSTQSRVQLPGNEASVAAFR